MEKRNMFFFLYAVVLGIFSIFTTFCYATSVGKLFFQFISYENKYGLDENFSKCDVQPGVGELAGQCDLVFMLQLSHHHIKWEEPLEWPLIRTPTYNETTQVNFRWGEILSSFGGIRNPVTFPLESWKGRLYYDLKVVDKDKDTNNDLVDLFTGYIPAIPTTEYQGPIKVTGLHGANSYFTFKLKITCNKHYYGKECSKYCPPFRDKLTNKSVEKCSCDIKSKTYKNDSSCDITKEGYICKCTLRYFQEDKCLETYNQTCWGRGVCLNNKSNNNSCHCASSFSENQCERYNGNGSLTPILVPLESNFNTFLWWAVIICLLKVVVLIIGQVVRYEIDRRDARDTTNEMQLEKIGPADEITQRTREMGDRTASGSKTRYNYDSEDDTSRDPISKQAPNDEQRSDRGFGDSVNSEMSTEILSSGVTTTNSMRIQLKSVKESTFLSTHISSMPTSPTSHVLHKSSSDFESPNVRVLVWQADKPFAEAYIKSFRK